MTGREAGAVIDRDAGAVIGVVVADDQAAVRGGFAALVEATATMHVVVGNMFEASPCTDTIDRGYTPRFVSTTSAVKPPTTIAHRRRRGPSTRVPSRQKYPSWWTNSQTNADVTRPRSS